MRHRAETVAFTVTTVAVLAVTAFEMNAHRMGTGYDTPSASGGWMHVVAGLSLIAAGWATRIVRRARGQGWCLVLTAATWFAADWTAWGQGPEAARTLGMVLEPLTVVVLAWTAVVITPTGRQPGRVRGVLVGASVLVLVADLVRLTVYDPLFDLDCWSNCTANSLLIARRPALAAAAATVRDTAALVVGAVAAWSTVSWLAQASASARRSQAKLLVPCLASLATAAAVAGSRAVGWTEQPEQAVFAALHRVNATTLLLLAIGIALASVERVRTRRAVAALSNSIAHLTADVGLEQVLASVTADPQLRIGYWVDYPALLVDAVGRPFIPDPDLVTTTVTRNGEPVAAVAQHPSQADRDGLARALGPTLRLAIDNERLRAASLARIAELQRSRTRIVGATDLARRRLERNLHDGAQQRLLAASFAARLAAGRARRDGDEETGTVIDHLNGEIQLALNELRSLAHGIHPAELTSAGLDSAVRTLATNTSIPVEISSCPDHRFDPALETTTYGLIADTIDLLTGQRATYASVDIAVTSDQLTVSIGHDTTIEPGTLIDITDRVGAAGGTLDTNDHLIQARYPCASSSPMTP